MVKMLEHVWNEHLSNLGQLFDSLYKSNVLLDVTLSCRGGGSLRAHKLVLSACSPYFARVFQENPCKHPTIILTTVALDDMTKLVEYMYTGRVHMPADRVDGILRVAGDLQVKGFETFLCETAAKRQQQQQQQQQPQQRKIEDFQQDASSVNRGLNIVNINKRNSEADSRERLPQIDLERVVNDKVSRIEALPEVSENESDCDEVLRKDAKPKVLSCEVCKRTFKTQNDLQKHKKIHQDKSFSCEFCKKLFSRASHLIRHRRVHTGERPFVCNICGKDFARQDKLKLHIRTNHAGHDLSNVPKDASTIGVVAVKDIKYEEDFDYDSEMYQQEEQSNNDHVTLGDLVRNEECAEKRMRGRPKKSSHDIMRIRRGRGRPRKDATHSQVLNYNVSDLPYGDIDYLTCASPIEPLVEISTDTNDETKTEEEEYRERESAYRIQQAEMIVKEELQANCSGGDEDSSNESNS